jgi:hypothetical protein
MHQSRDLDFEILSEVDRKDFTLAAEQIQKALTKEVIAKGFNQYPPEIRNLVAAEHAEILSARLQQLPEVAVRFHELTRTK